MKIMRPNTYGIVDPNQKRWVEDLYKLTNKNISFGTSVQYLDNKLANSVQDQNMSGVMVEVSDTGTANTTFGVIHNLGYIPKYYDVKYINGNGTIYDAVTSSWTTSEIFLKCSLATAHIRLFIH
jgi:hypothetical protein